MKFKFTLFCVLLYWGLVQQVVGQKPLNPVAPSGAKSIVEVLNSDIQEGVNLTDMRTQTFTGNVIFRHEGVLMGTNKAIQNATTNIVEAFGNIKINQGDTLTIVGDSLYYEGNTRIATIWGKSVILRDKKVTLRTRKVIYNMANGMAFYPVPGQIMQDSSKLSSNMGYYNTKTKYFNYIGDVEVMNPRFVLCTDSMDYDTYTKKAIFKTFTTIKGPDGNLTAERGWYNIQTKESYFSGRSKVDNEKYTLIGDTLNYNSDNDFGWARGNVIFISKADSLITVGNEGIRIGSQGITKINGETISRFVSKKESGLMAADTLRIIEKTGDLRVTLLDSGAVNSVAKRDSVSKKKSEPSRDDLQYLIATGNVKVYRDDMQSVSDSLVYNAVDSTIGYYKNPVLWHKKNQMKADSIEVFLKNNKINRMEMIRNCFIIEQDSLSNFNQIKGRNISTYFTDSSKIKEIYIYGNGESKYFILDDEYKVVGLDMAQCSSMRFIFKNEELDEIKFYDDYDASLVPPHEIILSESRFEDFDYRVEQKPSVESILALPLGKLLQETSIDGAGLKKEVKVKE